MISDSLDCWAVVAPGLEPLVAGELTALEFHPGSTEPGGVAFSTDAPGLARANLHLRTASRVIVRVARFRARAFGELERQAGRLPWERFVPPGVGVTFRVTSRKSRLYHNKGIAQRLSGAVAARVTEAGAAEPGGPDQEFVVRLLRDECTISADSSGDLLHVRGYREEVARAPLRETLAAAMLIGAGWEATRPLVDPFAGSGTIPIEGALLARRIPPGRGRRFAFEAWPAMDRAHLARARDEAEERILVRAPAPVLCADRDAGAVAAARANAGRAGVADDIEFRHAAISALELPAMPGWIITNPPYGVRVGEPAALRDLYARMGQVLRSRAAGWHVALLSANRRLESELRVPLATLLRTRNGGIPVRLVGTTVKAFRAGERD